MINIIPNFILSCGLVQPSRRTARLPDDNGELDSMEIRALCTQAGMRTEDEVNAAVAEMETSTGNGDGMVSFSEFMFWSVFLLRLCGRSLRLPFVLYSLAGQSSCAYYRSLQCHDSAIVPGHPPPGDLGRDC